MKNGIKHRLILAPNSVMQGVERIKAARKHGQFEYAASLKYCIGESLGVN